MQKTILDKTAIDQIITRLAYQIAEQNATTKSITLAGIAPAGVILSYQLKKILDTISTISIDVMAINMDKKNPKQIELEKQANFNDATVIIVDDVSMTGKTICYAMAPFLQFYPAKLQTLVLVEREQKLFPMHSDYVGKYISTTHESLIIVETNESELTNAYLT
jgi:pyrimidine operon attenuation protein / uracil phosphoribosyltransferase